MNVSISPRKIGARRKRERMTATIRTRHHGRNAEVGHGFAGAGEGEAPAFRGAKRLRRDRESWSQRVGADHRLLFRLHTDILEVVDLINRRDLERRIKSLTESMS